MPDLAVLVASPVAAADGVLECSMVHVDQMIFCGPYQGGGQAVRRETPSVPGWRSIRWVGRRVLGVGGLHILRTHLRKLISARPTNLVRKVWERSSPKR